MRKEKNDPETKDWTVLPYILLFVLIAFIIATIIAIAVQFIAG